MHASWSTSLDAVFTDELARTARRLTDAQHTRCSDGCARLDANRHAISAELVLQSVPRPDAERLADFAGNGRMPRFRHVEWGMHISFHNDKCLTF